MIVKILKSYHYLGILNKLLGDFIMKIWALIGNLSI